MMHHHTTRCTFPHFGPVSTRDAALRSRARSLRTLSQGIVDIYEPKHTSSFAVFRRRRSAASAGEIRFRLHRYSALVGNLSQTSTTTTATVIVESFIHIPVDGVNIIPDNFVDRRRRWIHFLILQDLPQDVDAGFGRSLGPQRSLRRRRGVYARIHG